MMVEHIEREVALDTLKPCCFHNPLSDRCNCYIEVIRTAANPPKNIRIGCSFHSVWLKECFETVGEACNEWNRQMDGDGNG